MKAPAFQWYPKDCDADEAVRAMTDQEFGFYIRLLNHSWVNNGLPTELRRLARVMGRSLGYVTRLWPAIGPCFEERNGRLMNPRQERQRESTEAWRQQCSEYGKRGGRPRAAESERVPLAYPKPTLSLPLAEAKPSQSPHGDNPSSSSSSEGIERDPKDHPAPGTSFEAFWAFFIHAGVPLNDRDKEKALRLWLCCEPSEYEQILRWTAEQMQSTWTDAKHTPWPANALQSEGWKRTAATRTLPSPRQERIILPLPRGTPRDISPEEAAETERKLAEAKAAGKFKAPNL